MTSDSWLSKNVRPLALIFLTVTTVGLAYVTSFMEATDILSEWIDLLKVLDFEGRVAHPDTNEFYLSF